jgi:hypothetical protein
LNFGGERMRPATRKPTLGSFCVRFNLGPTKGRCSLLGEVRNHNKNINDRLGGQTGYGRRPNVLDPQSGVAKRADDDPGMRVKLLRPIRVVVDNLDLGLFSAPDQSDCQRFIYHHRRSRPTGSAQTSRIPDQRPDERV